MIAVDDWSFAKNASLRTADYSPAFLKWTRARKFRHPETGNQVVFESLPPNERAQVHAQWKGPEKAPAPPGSTPVTPENFGELEEGDRLFVHDRETGFTRNVEVTRRSGPEEGSPHVYVHDADVPPEERRVQNQMVFYPEELGQWADVSVAPRGAGDDEEEAAWLKHLIEEARARQDVSGLGHEDVRQIYAEDGWTFAREAGYAKKFLDWLRGRKFRNPETGNQVLFESLPPKEQAKVHARWQQAEQKQSLGTLAEELEGHIASADDLDEIAPMIHDALPSNVVGEARSAVFRAVAEEMADRFEEEAGRSHYLGGDPHLNELARDIRKRAPEWAEENAHPETAPKPKAPSEFDPHFEKAMKGKEFLQPGTEQIVSFESLPPEEQKRVYREWQAEGEAMDERLQENMAKGWLATQEVKGNTIHTRDADMAAAARELGLLKPTSNADTYSITREGWEFLEEAGKLDKKATYSPDFLKSVEGRKFRNPRTRRDVRFRSLPPEEQELIHRRWKKQQEHGGEGPYREKMRQDLVEWYHTPPRERERVPGDLLDAELVRRDVREDRGRQFYTYGPTEEGWKVLREHASAKKQRKKESGTMQTIEGWKFLKDAAYSPEFLKWVKGRKFRQPGTGNRVVFSSLPASEKRKVHRQWKKSQPEETKGWTGKRPTRAVVEHFRAELQAKHLDTWDEEFDHVLDSLVEDERSPFHGGSPDLDTDDENEHALAEKKFLDARSWTHDILEALGRKNPHNKAASDMKDIEDWTFVKTAYSSAFLAQMEGRSFPHPQTGQQVPFGLLPPEEQAGIHETWRSTRPPLGRIERYLQETGTPVPATLEQEPECLLRHREDFEAERTAESDREAFGPFSLPGPAHSRPTRPPGIGEIEEEPPPPAQVKQELANRMREMGRTLMVSGMRAPRQQIIDIGKILNGLIDQLEMLSDQPGRAALKRRILLGLRNRVLSSK